MKCPKCNLEIEDGSKFCNHCGAKIQVKNNDAISSTLLFVWAIVTFTCVVIQAIFNNIFPSWYSSTPAKVFYLMVTLIQNLSDLLIPFAIKKIPLKIVAFVLVGIFVTYWVYLNIKFMF